MTPLAVTGIGVVSPLGIGREAFWHALAAGRSGIAALERVRVATPLPRIGAEVRHFAARDFIGAANLRRMPNLARYVVAAARMAHDDAGLAAARVAPERLGVVVGSAMGDINDSIVYLEKLFGRGPAAASPLLFPNLVLNAPASYVAMELGATGVNLTVSHAEISGEQAVAQGCEAIRAGRADVVLAGGGDELGGIVLETAFRGRALSGQRGGEEWSSPYDRDRNGKVFGEGAAMLALESLEHARARGAAILATIEADVAFGVRAPAYDWPASGAEAAAPLRRLCGEAGVDLVVGAANSSRRLDACELSCFGALGGTPWVTSIKGAVGEIGGGGALSLAAACLALHEQTVPPLALLRTPAPAQGLRLAERTGAAAPLQRALVSGLARGGAGIALLLRRG